MKNLIEIMAYGFVTIIFMLILVPILRVIAIKFNLVDHPNNRKVHSTPVPLVGGIAITIAVGLINLVNYSMNVINHQQLVIISSSIILLLVGVLDDKYDINAKYKLAIQFFCALMVTATGTRLTSLYGIFGIYEIPVFLQYAISIIIICGVVNAFNLMDGIDGLSGELALIGFLFLGLFSFISNDIGFTILFASFFGATIGFLRFNLGKKKIFMGDAGSLLIGNILVNSSIYLLNKNTAIITSNPVLLSVIIGFLALPVLDSLRVYLGRLKKGNSPFKADKTHLHHLILLIESSHRRVSIVISIISICILLFTVLMQNYVSITLSLIIIVITFSVLGFFLNLNKKVFEWREAIKKLEDQP